MKPEVYGAIVAAVSLAAWVVAVRRGRLRSGAFVRSLRNGALAAALVFVAAALIITVLMNGRQFIYSELELHEAMYLGLLGGVVLAVCYMVLVLLVLPFGFLLLPADRWSRLASVAPAVVAVVLYAGWRVVDLNLNSGDVPRTIAGSVAAEFDGERLGHIVVSGPAACDLFRGGDVSIIAGLDNSLTSSAGGDATIQLYLAAGPRVSSLYVQVGTASGDNGQGAPRIQLDAGASAASGTLKFDSLMAIQPVGENELSDVWSGTISWACPASQG